MDYSLLQWDKEKTLAYQKNELYLSSFKSWADIQKFMIKEYFKPIPKPQPKKAPDFIGSEDYFKFKALLLNKFNQLKKEYHYDKAYIHELSKIELSSLYKPQDLSKIISQKKGDCKDFTFLALSEIQQMIDSRFKNAPISLYIGLTHDQIVAKESKNFPSLSWFNHIFLMIKINHQELIYFDLTADVLDSPKLKHKRVLMMNEYEYLWID
jgi:hypothetical protein